MNEKRCPKCGKKMMAYESSQMFDNKKPVKVWYCNDLRCDGVIRRYKSKGGVK